MSWFQVQRVCFVMALLFMAGFGCKAKRSPRIIERSFYYWKSSFNPGKKELDVLNALQVHKLYVKFFDVGWNESKREPMPLALINFPANGLKKTFLITPTVFITNDCMAKMQESQVNGLATRILSLINKISTTNQLGSTTEIQIDCDWTITTKTKYFSLLRAIKDSIAQEKKILSATIRLYQYKYSNKAGMPPVDRGLLMCYNMGNLKNPDTKNSILDPHELEKYMKGSTNYPLPVDIALPLFSWKVYFKKNKYAGLIRELPSTLLKNNASIKQSGNKFEVLQNITINGYHFETGDMIREEEISYDEIVATESILNRKIKRPRLGVVLYHLDSITLAKFSTHELEKVFSYLR